MAKKRDQQRLDLCAKIQQEFGKRFRSFRKEKGFVQKSLVGDMDLTRASISNIERGTQRLYLDQVFQAAYALGVEVADLLPRVDEVYNKPTIHTASDRPLTGPAEEEVTRIIQQIIAADSQVITFPSKQVPEIEQ